MLSREAATQVLLLQSTMAGAFFYLARLRPKVAVESKIYGGCALAFAAAAVPAIVGTSPEISQKFGTTIAEWTDIAYISMVALPYVAIEVLATNAIGAAIGMLAIVAILDPFILQMTYFFDFCSVTALGLTVVATDRGMNPKAEKCLIAATALYSTVQLQIPGKGTAWFSALISGSSLAFSLCLLIVMYARIDELPHRQKVAEQFA